VGVRYWSFFRDRKGICAPDAGKGGIINVASATAFSPMPYWSNYAASKSYLLHFSEGFGYEMKATGVDVLAVCPGATRTEFAAVAGINPSGMEVRRVVATGLKYLGRKPRVIVGLNNRIITVIMRFFSLNMQLKIGAKVVQGMQIHPVK